MFNNSAEIFDFGGIAMKTVLAGSIGDPGRLSFFESGKSIVRALPFFRNKGASFAKLTCNVKPFALFATTVALSPASELIEPAMTRIAARLNRRRLVFNVDLSIQ